MPISLSKLVYKPVKRSDLEYPTEDVSFIYLTAISKVASDTKYWNADHVAIYCVDPFTDKAVEIMLIDTGKALGRYQKSRDWYDALISSGRATSDFVLRKCEAGSITDLGSEAVDLTENYFYRVKLSISGSTLKGFREDMATPKITVTDSTFTSGYYGCVELNTQSQQNIHLDFWLRPPSSKIPKPKIILDIEVEGTGTLSNPLRPSLLHNIIDNGRYGKVDTLSVSWGVFDFKPKASSLATIVVYSDNPYNPRAVEKHVEYAKNKNLRVLKPPRDYTEAVEQYKGLRVEHKEWLAGKDNFAYQTLGDEVYELFSVADFYYGHLLEHKKGYKQLKQVPDWELRRTLNRWRGRLEKVNVLTGERDKHLKKLVEVLRKGW